MTQNRLLFFLMILFVGSLHGMDIYPSVVPDAVQVNFDNVVMRFNLDISVSDIPVKLEVVESKRNDKSKLLIIVDETFIGSLGYSRMHELDLRRASISYERKGSELKLIIPKK